MSAFLVGVFASTVLPRLQFGGTSGSTERCAGSGQSGQRADKCGYGIRCEAVGACLVLLGSVILLLIVAGWV